MIGQTPCGESTEIGTSSRTIPLGYCNALFNLGSLRSYAVGGDVITDNIGLSVLILIATNVGMTETTVCGNRLSEGEHISTIVGSTSTVNGVDEGELIVSCGETALGVVHQLRCTERDSAVSTDVVQTECEGVREILVCGSVLVEIENVKGKGLTAPLGFKLVSNRHSLTVKILTNQTLHICPVLDGNTALLRCDRCQ